MTEAKASRTVSVRLIRVLQAVVSVGVVAYLLSFLNLETVARLWDLALWRDFWVAPALMMAGVYLAALRWVALLRWLGAWMRQSRAFCVYLISTFYNVILPGVLGGDAVRIGYGGKITSAPMSTVFVSVFMERYFGLVGLGGLGTLVLVLNLAFFREHIGMVPLLILPAALFSILAIGMFLTLGAERLLATDQNRSGIWAKISSVAEMAVQFRKIPIRLLASVVSLGLLFQLSEIVVFIYFAGLLGIDISPLAFLVIVPMVYLVTLLPISIGGLGVREGTLVFLLGGFNVPPGLAVLLALLVYLNRVVLALVGGVIQWLPCGSMAPETGFGISPGDGGRR